MARPRASWRGRGKERLVLKLRDLPQDVAGELRTAARENARDVHLLQVATVPRVEGDLAASLSYYPVKITGEIRWRVTAGNETAFYARMVEFGTPSRAATPFFYPAYRKLRTKIRYRNRAALRRAIRKIQRRR